MKPLTEVIEDAERCLLPFPGDCINCPHFDSTDDDLGYDCAKKILRDAVEWLKGYHGHIELDELRDKLTADNSALTWDELKQMEGKPVWVEGSLLLSHWFIIDEIDDDHIICADRFRMSIPLYHDVMGRLWQAYRKERK